MTDEPVPLAAVFGASNLALFGVLEDLAAAGDLVAADAWLRASCAFTVGERQRVDLLVTAYDASDRSALEEAWSAVTSALGRHAGWRPDNAYRTTIKVTLAADCIAPGQTAAQLAERVLRARDTVVRDGLLREEARAALPAQTELLVGALEGARVVPAGSESSGAYDMLAVGSGQSSALPRLTEAVDAVSDALYRSRTGGSLNNRSPVVVDVTTATLAVALAGYATTPRASGKPRVGVITPGGAAAPQDVLSKLAGRTDVDYIGVQVFLSDPTDLSRRMISAVATVVDQGATSVVVGFGGGDRSRLLRVHASVTAAIGDLHVPAYVGIGHHDFAEMDSAAHVRTCTTPADATALFIAEALVAPQRRAQALERARSSLVIAGIDADAQQRVMAKLASELDDVETGLVQSRALHLQPPG